MNIKIKSNLNVYNPQSKEDTVLEFFLFQLKFQLKFMKFGTILRLKWRKKFKGNLKERVKEKVHYTISFDTCETKAQKWEKSVPFKRKTKKKLFIRWKNQWFLGKNKDFLKKANSFHENVHKINKKRENPFWSVGNRSKSEEKMVQINNFKISRFFVNENERNKKEKKERPLSVNLNKVLSFDEKKTQKIKDFPWRKKKVYWRKEGFY